LRIAHQRSPVVEHRGGDVDQIGAGGASRGVRALFGIKAPAPQ
jgi:hypothetical protein